MRAQADLPGAVRASVHSHVAGEFGGAPGGPKSHRHSLGPRAAEPFLMGSSGLCSGQNDRRPVEPAGDDQRAAAEADRQVDAGSGGKKSGCDHAAVIADVAKSGVPRDAALDGHLAGSYLVPIPRCIALSAMSTFF